MADVKVSALSELAAGDLDPVADFLLVSDMSASASKKMKASEMIRASLPYLSTFWDFTTGSLLPTVSFTRASAGYRYNSSGVLVSETTDVARFHYDPVSLAPRGLLIEGAATNLLTYSEEFDNAAWTKFQSSISANATTAPDGTLTADALVENAVAATLHNASRAPTYLNATTYVHKFRFKPDTRTWGYIYTDPARFGGAGYTYFNLSTGATGTVSAGMTAFAVQDASGFWNCVVIGTTTSAGTGNLVAGLATGNNGATYSGDGASKAYLWGASVVAADVLTSYIKTAGATATRAADVALITNPQALADQCWIVKGRTPRKISGGAVNVALQFDGGDGNNRRTLRYGTDGRLHAIATVLGADQCDLDLGAVANDTDFAVAVRWADGNFAASLNGGAIVTDLSGSNPLGLTTARVGRSSTGNYWNSTIRTIETRRTASDAELPLLAA